jgi:hypothetical protein
VGFNPRSLTIKPLPQQNFSETAEISGDYLRDLAEKFELAAKASGE